MSIGHHLLHLETQNYFQQILCMSGTAMTPFSYRKGDHQCLMELLASFTQPVQNIEELIEFLQNVPVEEFMKLPLVTQNPVDIIWAPIVESKLTSKITISLSTKLNTIDFYTLILEFVEENAINPYIPVDPLEHLENLSSINKTAYFTFTNRVSESNQRIVGLNSIFFSFSKFQFQ